MDVLWELEETLSVRLSECLRCVKAKRESQNVESRVDPQKSILQEIVGDWEGKVREGAEKPTQKQAPGSSGWGAMKAEHPLRHFFSTELSGCHQGSVSLICIREVVLPNG